MLCVALAAGKAGMITGPITGKAASAACFDARHCTFSPAGARVIVRLRLHVFLLGLALVAAAVAVRYPSFLALGPSTDDGYGHISEFVSAAGGPLTMGVLPSVEHRN